MTLKYHVLKILGLHSCWVLYLLVTPLLILNLSQQNKIPVALALGLNHHVDQVLKQRVVRYSIFYPWKSRRHWWSWSRKNSSHLSGLDAHATTSEQQKILICGFLWTSLPKSLNTTCSKFSALKPCLNLWSYSQNRVHKLFPWVWTVASLVVLIPLHCKCGRSYSAYFDKNVTCCTQEKYFWNTQGNCLLHWYSTEDGGWNQTEALRYGSATYYCAEIYHRHLVMPT